MQLCTTGFIRFFYCWWALFGNRAAGKRPRKVTVYTKHRLTLQELVSEALASQTSEEGTVPGKARSSCMEGGTRRRRRVCSATCTRWATARAAAGNRVERERLLILSWGKAEKDSKESRKATRRQGDDLEDSWCLLFVLIRQGLRGKLVCS
jgi:hypothetical protein